LNSGRERIVSVEFFGFGRVKREVWLNDGSIVGKVPKSAMKKKRNTNRWNKNDLSRC
jgi:hypothetical protein